MRICDCCRRCPDHCLCDDSCESEFFDEEDCYLDCCKEKSKN